MTDTTVFDIRFPSETFPGVAPYSARGLRGTLKPIDDAQGSSKLRRTSNGTLIDISAPQMRKYRLEVSGSDQEPPALDGIWCGMAVEVDCHVEVSYKTSGGTPSRDAVSGSSYTDGDYTFYRPQLQMRVVEYQIDRQEWAAEVDWNLVLEEI